ncbi:hypothetical protein ACFLTD_02980 [Elusimicrobiota bacterium]
MKYIIASTHIIERERIGAVDEYIENIQLLKNNGFMVLVVYVMRPVLFNRFEDDHRYFKSRGIDLFPVVYRGWHNMKMYPMSYSRRQSDLIIKYNPQGIFHPFCFRGRKCNAGRTYMRIRANGEVNRCNNDSRILGDVISGIKLDDSPGICREYVCSCYGYRLVVDNKLSRYKSNFRLWHLLLSKNKLRYDLRIFRYISNIKYHIYGIRDSIRKRIKKVKTYLSKKGLLDTKAE